MTLKSESHYWTLTLRTLYEHNCSLSFWPWWINCIHLIYSASSPLAMFYIEKRSFIWKIPKTKTCILIFLRICLFIEQYNSFVMFLWKAAVIPRMHTSGIYVVDKSSIKAMHFHSLCSCDISLFYWLNIKKSSSLTHEKLNDLNFFQAFAVRGVIVLVWVRMASGPL